MGQSQSKRRKRIKQKPINMIGCSKSHKHNKSCSSCKNCGPNCHCGSNCNCPHKCPGNCYLNRTMKGGGCGSGSCPVGGFLRGGTNLIYTNNTPPGFSYNPSANPSLQATENTGYLMRNKVGGYLYKGKYSKKQSKSVLKGKTKTKSKIKSHTTKYKTFKNYKYNGGGLGSEIYHNLSVALSAIRGVPPPFDPSPQVQPYLSSTKPI